MKLADIQFESLYQLLELIRQRELSDHQRCKDIYQAHYLYTVCRFGHRGWNPYKIKRDMLIRTVEKGEKLSCATT